MGSSNYMSLEKKEQLGYYLKWKQHRRQKNLVWGIQAGKKPNSYECEGFYTEGRDALNRMYVNLMSTVFYGSNAKRTPIEALRDNGLIPTMCIE